MDVKKAIAAAPVLRRLWRILPGPLRVPLLVVGALYAMYRYFRGADEDDPGADPAN